MPVPRIAIEAKVVADPELRFGPSGTAVCRLRLVASDRRKNQQTDQWEDGDTLWINATCFKKLAENVAESIAKSDLVVVTGKIKTEEWTNREGQKQSTTALIADTVSVSLKFRTVPHGAGQAERTTAQPTNDPWATPAEQADEPPF